MDSPVRIRLDIAYDGTAFSGWAVQPGLRTVQGTLEDALRILYRDLPEDGALLTVAGRTDAGVHALGQVAHLDLRADQWAATTRRAAKTEPPDAFVRRMAGIIGNDADVVVTKAAIAPAGFDARFSATWRRYEYRLADLATPPNPLERHRTALVRGHLDVDRMNEAARMLVGLHDFAGFCRPRAGATTVRTLQRFEWRRSERGTFIADVQADAFCHSMVRSLVGMCAAVGQGRLAVDRVSELLEVSERSNAFAVLPARGLTLTAVGYPDDPDLAARQEATRAKRPALRVVGG
ncbi:tRNA pseudouridine synthase A [Pseudoclavibacter endophyticus]|uniref:tRNA pseudouridine synthase A n=1 Tax=Pseudoclavibacter endophyticus TaxID=1778590 RepID=A0A6H9WJE6_9MICO|nr:tRNA pseudouridine(38-40) synthase TruA [Pseudoclavibacter endophyticus]KAB1649313.1 tRNA pseudouridine(38-40) synthase TruA [Pseudoclavibacter endophyticus]GGA63588.1 tRNA pseudouridine synthase A [Pseudoclavibacter endophyticus]